MPKISVIVPVYNVEQYLPKCIESILKQTFSNFELLLIDDGTPDHSGAICDRYAQTDNRVRVFHKENGGVSSARNLGLKEAKGEWVIFVDSDDWIEHKSFEILSSFFLENSLDFIQFGYKRIASKDNSEILYNKTFSIITNKEDYFSSNSFSHAICGNLMKHEIITKYNISFTDGIKYCEDQEFVLKYLLVSKKFIVLPDILYNYYNHINSASAAITTFSSALDHLKVAQNIILFDSIHNSQTTVSFSIYIIDIIKGYFSRLARINSTDLNYKQAAKEYNLFYDNNKVYILSKLNSIILQSARISIVPYIYYIKARSNSGSFFSK